MLPAMADPVRLIIDTDPGVDDAWAILMALAHPRATVEALTTVAGNVSLEHTTRNACAIVDVAASDVPVFAGSSGPLVGQRVEAGEVHGADGLGDAGRSSSQRRPEDEHAASAIVRLAGGAPGAMTLVAIGPLTNVALAVRLDPELPQRLGQLVVMGGAHRATGNTSAVAEFNVFADPEAAAVVFDAWPELTLVTWESTLAHPLSADLMEDASPDAPRSAFLRETSAHTIAYVRDFLGSQELYVPDPLAMAVALEPEIISAETRCAIRVELTGSLTRGQTVADNGRFSGRSPTVRVVDEVNRDRLRELLLLAFQ